MTETFEIGQKVRHAVRGEANVAYGPFVNPFGQTRYILRLESGREYYSSPSDISAIPEPPKFAVGDVVTLATRSGSRATVEYGPFDDGDIYVVKLVDEPTDADSPRTFTAMAHVMAKVTEPEPIKVGDRVRVTDDDGGGRYRFNERVGTVKELNGGNLLPYLVEFGDGRGRHGDLNGRWNCRAVERVTDENTHVHDGVMYDLDATYSDRDNEPWTFKRFGDEIRGGCNGYPPSRVSESLENVVTLYGPLTRIAN